jgi:NADPH:quinone reductase-like Zn-dependent oxidoreductase/short-subunit dehydrogenase/SAM-dependent methyltransferase/acyl carrier protein
LHPAVLDACFQTLLAAFPTWTNGQSMKEETFVPVKIERVRFYTPLPTHMLAYTRVTSFGPTGLTVDVQIVDESGACHAEVQGLAARQTGYRARRLNSPRYEYQWILRLRDGRGGRDSCHLSSPQLLHPFLQQQGEFLWRRFDRARFQNHFRDLLQAAAAAYIARALRELGRTPTAGDLPAEMLANRLGIAQQYHGWLKLVLPELTQYDIGSIEDPHRLWKALWDQFPECQAELKYLRLCGESLPAVLRGDVKPVDLIFPEGGSSGAETLLQDSPTFRLNNLLLQMAIGEVVRRLPKGRALRILEIGGRTGGATSFVLSVLPEHCSQYVFTDALPRFVAHAEHKFSQYPHVQYRTLDIERDPLAQGFEAHSFDLIIAFDSLHATKDLRQTLSNVTQLLGSGGLLAIGELTRPWLSTTLIFGLLEDWSTFDDGIRLAGPCISQEQWKGLLQEAGFTDTACVADGPLPGNAQHAVIVARGPQLTASPALAPNGTGESRTWLLFADDGSQERPSVGTELALKLQERGDTVIQVRRGIGFHRFGASSFNIRAGNADDMRRLMERISKESRPLSGIIHMWSLDGDAAESMTNDAIMTSTRLGCVAVAQTVQSLATMGRSIVENIWIVTNAAQPLDRRPEPIRMAQAPLWGLGRVAINEYQNLRFRLLDLATCCREEIESLAEELNDAADPEDEIALYGELRYVRRLVPVSSGLMNGTHLATRDVPQRFRIQVRRPGILDSLDARAVARETVTPNEVEIEVVAAGLNFMDLMLVMGMLPPEVTGDGLNLPGLECAGRVIAVGKEVSEFAIGDEVIACQHGAVASHVRVDARFVVPKPRHLSFEQAATIPIAFFTAYYSLHTLGQLQRGERVLIHSATGGLGLAAVQLAVRAGAIVFATAGSPEKRELLTALGVSHVMDSRSLAFADEVLNLTNGEGVDLVLNSLAGEAIDKGLSILRPHGRFLEVGKTDVYRNRKIGMRPLRKNVSMFVVDLLGAVEPRPDLARWLMREVLGLFERNELRPLPHRVVPVTRVAEAFRDMAQAKHIGKLIISMQDTEGLQVEPSIVQPVSIVADAVYLITGGLGGFGLAVADHLVRRGARHLALLGRSGISPAKEAAVEELRHRGVEVTVFAADVTDREQIRHVIATIGRDRPLRGIMHAAMVLDDVPIEHLTEERMWRAMAPKIIGAWNLHVLTRDLPLDFFVLFSSFTSIIGNPGQANYVAGNAFLDALAHYRRARGLPALAINWGVVGEVGHAAASPETADRLDRLGLKTMSLGATLDALDEVLLSDTIQIGPAEVEWKRLLRSRTIRNSPRYAALGGDNEAEESGLSVSSAVHDILEADAALLPSLLETHIREQLARAMGSAPAGIDTQRSLRNLGIDSLIAVEIRNRINTDFGVNVPLVKLMQNESIKTLADFIAERLIERNRSEKSQSAAHEPGVKFDAPLSAADAADLLERIDELTDEEVERQLSLLEPRGDA